MTLRQALKITRRGWQARAPWYRWANSWPQHRWGTVYRADATVTRWLRRHHRDTATGEPAAQDPGGTPKARVGGFL